MFTVIIHENGSMYNNFGTFYINVSTSQLFENVRVSVTNVSTGSCREYSYDKPTCFNCLKQINEHYLFHFCEICESPFHTCGNCKCIHSEEHNPIDVV